MKIFLFGFKFQWGFSGSNQQLASIGPDDTCALNRDKLSFEQMVT